MWPGKFEVTALEAPDHDAMWRELKSHFRDPELLLYHLLDVVSASSSRAAVVKALLPSRVFACITAWNFLICLYKSSTKSLCDV